MTLLITQTFLLLRKDLRLEIRRRESLLTMFFFGTLLLFVFHFSFEAERGNHCLDALLLSPMDRGALFLAKVCFNIILMVLVEIFVIPLFWILFNLPSWEVIPSLFSMAFLGTVGFCVLGTLLSAVTLKARARELLLPLVLFPLVVPVILATIRCMETVLRTGEIGAAAPWLRLLVGFDVIFLTLGVLIFDWVIDV